MPTPLRLLLAVACLFLAGCIAPGPPADYNHTRAVCGLDPGEHAVGGRIDAWRLERPLDDACVQQLGADLGLDWASFGRSPGAVDQVDDLADAVVAGAFVLVATDLGTLDARRQDPLRPPWGGAALDDEAARLGLTDDTPVGQVYYAWATARIRSIVLRSDLDDVTARYKQRGQVVEFADLGHVAFNPIWFASVLVHEASHLPAPGHEPCVDDPQLDEACDDDLSGPYGLQAWLLASIADTLDPNTDEGVQSCVDVTEAHSVACRMVNDTSGSPLCSQAPACG